MGIEEKRIFTQKPSWLGLEELSRTGTHIWFKTKTGKMLVSIKEVEKYEQKK